MIEEAQKECLKSLKEYIDLDPFFNGTKKIESDFDKFCFDHCKDIDNALDIVEKQSKEIEELEYVLSMNIPKQKIKEIYEDFENNKPVIAICKLKKLLEESEENK